MVEFRKRLLLIAKLPVLSFIIGAFLMLFFGYFSLKYRSFLPLFISIAYICFHKFYLDNEYRILFRTSFKMLFISAVISYVAFAIMYFHPREWDFTCFYLYGKVAVSGLNFYSPQDFHNILKTVDLPIKLSADFVREIIDVACPYPPPTLLLFSTLGFMSFEKAYVFWFILNHLFLIGSILLIKNIFYTNSRYLGIMMSTILVFTFNPTLQTTSYSQILFILFFVLLLTYKFRGKPVSGLYLAIAVFLKPFTVILFLYFIFVRRPRTVLVFILSCIGLCLLASAFFGFKPFIEYILNNPTSREPSWIFTESTNQSLLAELLRLLPSNQSIARNLYYFFTFILLLVVGLIIYFNRKNTKNYDILFPMLLSVSLIIYPNGQYFYPVVHILSLLILLKYFNKLDISALLICSFYLVSFAGLFYINIFLISISIIALYKSRFIPMYSIIRTSLKSGS
jgi:hypothetical protein